MNDSIKSYKAATCALVLCVSVALASLFALITRAGFCSSEQRFLTKKDLIQRAIIQLDYPGWVDLGKPIGLVATVPYGSVDDFLAANPDCCQLDSNEPHELHPPTFLEFIRGQTAHTLRVQYSVRYLLSDKSIGTKHVTEEYFLGKCGELHL